MSEKTLRNRIASYFNLGANAKQESMKAYTEHIVKTVNKSLDHSFANHPLPLCTIDEEGKFIWFNTKFSDIFQNSDLANSGIYRSTGVKAAEFFAAEAPEKFITVASTGKTYKVVASFSQEDNKPRAVLYWIDVTTHELLKNIYKDEKNCFA